MDVASYCHEHACWIENELSKLVEEKNLPYNELFKAARYSLLSSGKRLRPILMMAIAAAFGADKQKALMPALALEMIHTYSLIHDDLPCMDNDDYRRGRLTLHKVVPEWHALLTGDFLLTYAFELISNAQLITESQKLKLISLFSKNAGAHGMIGGQVMDLMNVGKEMSIENLEKLHSLKTGALLSAAVVGGAIIAGVEDYKEIEDFGEKIGLAFQIIDDVLDVTASEEKHGKKVSTDVINNKITYVSHLGVEGSKQAASNLLSSAKEHLRKTFKDSTFLELLAEKLVYRTI
ncbi:MAG: polyprenyl synthetase family protein [Chlamydiales bacterium]|nr:polyprenyl synthetase family protein [Chlamydiales bacterium]